MLERAGDAELGDLIRRLAADLDTAQADRPLLAQMPLMQLSTLVLPAPFGPMSANSSPRAT